MLALEQSAEKRPFSAGGGIVRPVRPFPPPWLRAWVFKFSFTARECPKWGQKLSGELSGDVLEGVNVRGGGQCPTLCRHVFVTNEDRRLPRQTQPYSSSRRQIVLGWSLCGIRRIFRAIIGGLISRSSAMYVLMLPGNTCNVYYTLRLKKRPILSSQ